MRIRGLEVSYRDGIVTISGPFERLRDGDMLRTMFPMSRPGSNWGADGIGYLAQQKTGRFTIHRSGVGPRVFKKTIRALGA